MTFHHAGMSGTLVRAVDAETGAEIPDVVWGDDRHGILCVVARGGDGEIVPTPDGDDIMTEIVRRPFRFESRFQTGGPLSAGDQVRAEVKAALGRVQDLVLEALREARRKGAP